MRWLIALAIVVAGVIVGSIVSGQVRRFVSRSSRPERIRNLAQPFASLAFSVVLAVALVSALGVADRPSLERIPQGLLSFIPKALVCTLMIILGQAAATLVASAVGGSVLRATGRPQHQLVRVVKGLVFGAFVVMAVSQLGVNTRLVDTLVAGLVFGGALSVALLTGLGGREIASELAAGRYLRRIVRAGDRIAGDGLPDGTVAALHGASVELRLDAAPASATESGEHADTVTFVHVPNRRLLQTELHVTRRVADRPSGSERPS